MVVRVGVIGCGVQGRAHLEQHQQFEGVEIAAVCDLDPARAESVRRQLADVVRRVRAGEEVGLVTPHQALTLQRLIDAIYASAAQGREVSVGEGVSGSRGAARR